jgi:hypothetical protein
MEAIGSLYHPTPMKKENKINIKHYFVTGYDITTCVGERGQTKYSIHANFIKSSFKAWK